MEEKPENDISNACRVLRISRSSLAYKSIKDDRFLIEKLQDYAQAHPKEGFWKCYGRLRNSGEEINHKRLHRVYKQLGLPLRRKCKKRLPARTKETLAVPIKFTHYNTPQIWDSK